MQGFRLDQTFFGFKSSDRAKFHENLFELIWAGDGRWTFTDIYHMPIPMRKFWVNKMNDKYRANSNNAIANTDTSNIAKAPIKR